MFQAKDTADEKRGGGEGGTVVTAEASEVYKGHIIKGLKCQVKEFGLDCRGSGHLEKAGPRPTHTRSMHRT